MVDSSYEAATTRLRQKLRDSRIEAGLTQAEVGRILGKPQSMISKLETTNHRLEFLEVQILAQVYGKPLSHYEDRELSLDLSRATTGR